MLPALLRIIYIKRTLYPIDYVQFICSKYFLNLKLGPLHYAVSPYTVNVEGLQSHQPNLI